jgi:glutathione S-transferase
VAFPRIELFGYGFSHYCVAADRMFRFKRIPFEAVRVPYHDRTELIARTHQDYVPAVLIDGRVTTWKEIPGLIETLQPNPSFYPPGQRAVATTLAQWGHLVLEERVWRLAVTEVASKISNPPERWVFEEMQTRARGPWNVLIGRREEFRADLLEYFGMVEELLQDKPWVLGAPSMADFAIYGALSPFWWVGERTPAEFSRVEEWRTRISELGPTPWS